MLLQTQGDGWNAVQQLLTDISATASQVSQASSSSNFLSGFFGGDDVAGAAASLLAQLSDSAGRAAADLGGDATAPLTDEQVARLKELQSEVISDRKLVGQAISSVDWTFGQFVSDVANQTANIASQAVAAVSSGLGINWTVVEIGAALLAAVLAYALYRRVRG
jgi:hypothetical protein